MQFIQWHNSLLTSKTCNCFFFNIPFKVAKFFAWVIKFSAQKKIQIHRFLHITISVSCEWVSEVHSNKISKWADSMVMDCTVKPYARISWWEQPFGFKNMSQTTLLQITYYCTYLQNQVGVQYTVYTVWVYLETYDAHTISIYHNRILRWCSSTKKQDKGEQGSILGHWPYHLEVQMWNLTI